ncbi:hypothetical protein DFH06DRAFT_1201742 [Mycena polygramma]|nr:hypothetical protein DFH06DRAFT_1201742 [Mycena polygramma]
MMALHRTFTQLDEFDAIPDPFAGNHDIDWAQVLSTPANTQSIPPSQPSSPEYFPDDPVDESFLAQLDMLDGTNPASSYTVPPSTLAVFDGQHPPHIVPSPVPPTVLTPPRVRSKRSREDSQEGVLTPSRKSNTGSSPTSDSRRKRRKGVDTSRLILAGFEEELTCPICCDIFVATHMLNCGHSFCGDCAWQWVVKNKKMGCPICRTPLTSKPMVPNISMDKMVDMHIQMLSRGYTGDAGWQTAGPKLAEFLERQKKWKNGAAERDKDILSAAVKPVAVWLVSDDEDDDEDDEDEDEYEDSSET